MATSVETEKCVRTHAGRNGTNGTEAGEEIRESAEPGGRRRGIAGGHLHAIFTWVVSIIVNFPSEVIARKRPWRAESHFSQEREARVRARARVHTRVRYLTPCLSTRETRPVRL